MLFIRALKLLLYWFLEGMSCFSIVINLNFINRE